MSAKLQYYSLPRRAYSRRELCADRVVNFVGAVIAWVGLPTITVSSWIAGDPVVKQVGFWAQGFGMVTMLNCSAWYHYLAWRWEWSKQLLSLDHVGITSMIVGCYVPVMLQVAAFRTLLFVCVLGLLGCLMEVWRLLKPESAEAKTWTFIDIAHVVRYLVMGWSCLVVMPAILEHIPAGALILYVCGGVLYTAGVGIFVSDSVEYHLAIWHVAVCMASLCFLMANLLYLVGLPLSRS